MGKDKLRKFAENATFRCMVQPSLQEVLHADHPLKGRWAGDFFHNGHPIVLELGCGKGDYTVALALRNPNVNYIGVDIKGARMWKGARFAELNALSNVAFLRTRIEFITSLFAPGEVSEIWITFADPQIGREKKRLTAPLFLSRYASFLAPGGRIRLKTDSRYLYEYTLALCRANALPVSFSITDLYAKRPPEGQEVASEGQEIARAGRESAGGSVSLRFTPDPPVVSCVPASRELVSDGPHPLPEAEGGHAPASPFPALDPSRSPEPRVATPPQAPAPSIAASLPTLVSSLDSSYPAATGHLDPSLFEVQTFYEKHFLAQGYPICYLEFSLDARASFLSPEWNEDRYKDEAHHAFVIQVHD